MKTYKKAEILFVSFELSQSIATGCEMISHHSYGSCKLYATDSTGETDVVFVDSIGCEVTPVDGQYNTICYDVPSSANNVFSS